MNVTKELLVKLNAAMADLQYLQKDKSVGGKYKVLTFDSLKAELLPVLRKHGLYLHCTLNSHERSAKDVQDKYGNSQTTSRTDVETTVSIYDVENPEAFVSTISIGSGTDNECKDPGKAQSYSFKAGVYHLFQLESGDDEESRFESNKKLQAQKEAEAKKKEAEAKKKVNKESLAKMVLAFSKLDYSADDLEAEVKKPLDEVTNADFAYLKTLYKELVKNAKK